MNNTQDTNILPIMSHRKEIEKSFKESRVTIISGETGCGKTTKVPGFILDDRDISDTQLVITQPRRISAISVAERVAWERKVKIGEDVGYEVRFNHLSSPGTKLKFVTEGILLRELTTNPKLQKYKAVIVDEAHERGLNCDFLIGLLLNVLMIRPDFRIILMSATLEVEKTANFFRQYLPPSNDRTPVNIIQVKGRYYPISVYNTLSPVESYFSAAVDTILQINFNEKNGDILVFLTGQVF